MSEIGTDIKRAAILLNEGKLVAIPTETVYGLAANALDEKAVLSVFEAKDRPSFDPLIVHFSGIEQVNKFAKLKEERLIALAEKFWPGPLTLLLPRKKIPDIVTSGLPRLGVRVPNHPLTLQLLRNINFPLAAPSANPFGYVSPTEAAHVAKQLGDKVDYILDGGACRVGLESTIVGEEKGVLVVYRLGGLSIEDIEKVAGRSRLKLNLSGNPVAPGQLKSHYSPKKKMVLGETESLLEKYSGKKVALICFGKTLKKRDNVIIFNLSEKGSMREAASKLFRHMRAADESNADLVVAGLMPEEGLGRAINDRLKRAAV
jgi:L-threonylcarbamoyladenylate synthase